MGMLSRFLERRNWRRRARAYVAVLQHEPDEEDTLWLAELRRPHDLDHARWELRYARFALGQLEAERDALDDRAPSLVARELVAALQRDHRIAAGMLDTVKRQFNARLLRYREVLGMRGAAEPLARRVGRELLRFTYGEQRFAASDEERAGELLRRYTAEFNVALQGAFGKASLPEDVRPSEAVA